MELEIKTLCDRCFEDVIEIGTFYKYGSCIYCEKCHSKIENELQQEMITEAYARTNKDNEQLTLIRRLA